MANTGIVRSLDDLGRVSIPQQLRDMLRLHPGDSVSFSLDGSCLLLTPHRDGLQDRRWGRALEQRYGYAYGIYTTTQREQGNVPIVDVPEVWSTLPVKGTRPSKYNGYNVYCVQSDTSNTVVGYVVVPEDLDTYQYTAAIITMMSSMV